MIAHSSSSRRAFLHPLAIGIVLLLVAGCAPKAKSASRNAAGSAPPVVVAKAQKKVLPLTVDAIGAVEPTRTAALRSQVTGTLLKIDFQEGQDVQQDDLLFEIDPRPFQNALRSADADREKIQVQLENARSQVARYGKLSAESMVSKEQFQSMQDNERALAAQLLAADAAVANSKLQLDYCSVRAPLPGRTGGLGAHEGDLVRASDAAVSLVTINQLSPIYVTFGVPQQYLGALARYRAAGEIKVNATPPGAGEAPETGTLSFVDNMVDSTTGTVKLKATFPNAEHRLWPGLFVTVRMTLAAPEVLTIPSSALQSDQKGQHVFVIKDDKTAELRNVTVERANESDSVITQGITEGEMVVIDGQLRVIPGNPVEIKMPAAGNAKPDTVANKGGKGKPK
jgi:membrane fusion protein, multidrug efflux system